MFMTNHEIALELMKLIQPRIHTNCEHHHPHAKPEEIAKFVSAVFTGILSHLPPQDAGKNQPE